MAVNAGRLKKSIEIWRYAESETELGAVRTELKKIRTVYGEIRPTRGSEFLEYYREANALQFKVTMRYIPGLTEKDVLVYKGRQFEINSIINILEENAYLEVYCTESKDKTIEEAADGEV
jgi:SPP1 family predicted phage head-tail adaptor